jgi:hypothetical protein
MIYDFGGFPEHIYRIQYPAPGSPALAARVVELLQLAGIGIQQDTKRGFDHAMYAPLAPAWPDADVPVVQLSIDRRYDPAEHLALGQALAPLRDDGILILGGGATTRCATSRCAGTPRSSPTRATPSLIGSTQSTAAPASARSTATDQRRVVVTIRPSRTVPIALSA